MYTIAKLLQEYHSKQSNVEHLRLGQWFLNEYGWKLGICPWSQLYHEENPAECVKIIDMWLRDNGYQFKGLPNKAVQKRTSDSEERQ
ncbi:MAG: hypothetical protein Tp1111DCM1126091_138 [Prokaryotic dsDNA virus sp.]|nr:MAG: hypothetical protein Tp1111DCM1126091_138 [Prokaryotic dsDNA virus sp.]|tara:strand:- start:14458 stop:14718 length:261 start_codon:yes stop_codon:yes gene_type:complete